MKTSHDVDRRRGAGWMAGVRACAARLTRRRDAAGPAAGTAAFLLAMLAIPAFGGVEEVKLKLPLKPKLAITGEEKIAIAPFVIANNGEKKNDRAQKIDVQAEFLRYLRLVKRAALHRLVNLLLLSAHFFHYRNDVVAAAFMNLLDLSFLSIR